MTVNIWLYILNMRKNTKENLIETVRRLGKASVEEIVKNIPTKMSRPWISTLLNRLVKEGKLLRSRSGRYVYYVLPEDQELLEKKISKVLKNESLQEDQVLEVLKKDATFLTNLRENTNSILYYAFTEMLNNAIEHSGSKRIDVSIFRRENMLSFEVRDKGVGVFRSIMNKRRLKSELEAIQDLLKGKTTTLPHSHSGEGIFFTSKIADVFMLDSYGYGMRVDNKISDTFVEETEILRGTKVRFEIGINTQKHLNDVFERYQSESGAYSFDKTEVLVKLYAAGTIYISRSQARRLVVNLDKFKVVVLDFEGIKTIGQAFADEIFRVFASKHPHIQLRSINVSETVNFMINRVAAADLV